MSPKVTILPAAEEDAPTLASIMTAAFSALDAACPLIWTKQVAEGMHEMVAVKGLFTPVQREHRRTFKAVDGDKVVGFATWTLPDVKAPKRGQASKGKGGGGLPDIPGMNMELWNEKGRGPQEAVDRDLEPSEDMLLSFFFVHPDYHRRGIGTSLLEWGIKKSEETKAKIWLVSTPQAVPVYEKSGWKVVERCNVDLGNYGGDDIYSRAWMLRMPDA